MDGEGERWFGPGETARRLGVTPKALRVYEREGLVVPRRAQSGWRLYGPAQIARLHQIIVLRDLGLPLKSIKGLVGQRARLREVLKLQRESLESQRAKIGRALELIETAQRRLDDGRDLSLDDLATLTKETVVQQPADMKTLSARFQTLVAERDPTGQASRAVQEMKTDAMKAAAKEIKEMMAEAAQLRAAGDIHSEAAKDLVRRWRTLTKGVPRPAEPELETLKGAYAEMLDEVRARAEPAPFDLAPLEFIKAVAKAMRDNGELD